MPRWPQRSRKIRSVSPSRVPPDQSGTVSPAATSARSGSRSRSARVTWVSRVPTVNVSTTPPLAAAAWVKRWASRSSASAYPLIEPDTSTSSTTRRGRMPRRRQAISAGSPIRRRLARRVREASTWPRCQRWCRAVRRSGGARAQGREHRGQPVLLGRPTARRRRGAAAPRCRWPSARTTSSVVGLARRRRRRRQRAARRDVGAAGRGRARPGQPVAGVEERLEDLVVARRGRRGRRTAWPGRPT